MSTVTEPDPLRDLSVIAAEEKLLAQRKAAATEQARAAIPGLLEKLGKLCEAAGPVPRKELAALGIISLREDETVKRPARKPKAKESEAEHCARVGEGLA